MQTDNEELKNDRLRAYERIFDSQLIKYRGKGIKTRFSLFLEIWQSSKRYDLDNSIKTILDCLQYGGAITDDNLCYEIRAVKHIDKTRPRVIFAIEPITPQLELFEDA